MKYRVDIIKIHIGETINLDKQRIVKVLSEQEWVDEYEHCYNFTCLIEDERGKKNEINLN